MQSAGGGDGRPKLLWRRRSFRREMEDYVGVGIQRGGGAAQSMDMLENDQFPPKLSFSSMSPRVANGRQGSPRVSKGFQGPRGTPGMGEMSYNQIDHI